MRTPGRTPPDPNVSTGDPATRKIIGEYRDDVWTTRDLEGEVFCALVVAAGWQSFSVQLSGAKIPRAYRLEPSALSSTPPDGQPMEKLGQKLGFDQTGLTTGWLAVAGAALVLGGVTRLMVRRRNTATE